MATATQAHTPGPWEAYNGHDRKLGSFAILGPQPLHGASTVICRTSDDTPLDAANAALVAAAPALLAALSDLLLEGGEVGFYATYEGRRAAERAQEAIAQARGLDTHRTT